MATEKILMAGVEKGRSRQELHEIIKEHSIAAGNMVKEQGGDNDLLQRLADDERIPFDYEELHHIVADFQQFTGRAMEQTEEFLNNYVIPRLSPYTALLGGIDSELSV